MQFLDYFDYIFEFPRENLVKSEIWSDQFRNWFHFKKQFSIYLPLLS